MVCHALDSLKEPEQLARISTNAPPQGAYGHPDPGSHPELSSRLKRSTPVARISLHIMALAVALTAAAATGVEGAAVVDEGCPVVPVGSQCPQRPLPARVLVLNQQGAGVAHTDTNGKGEVPDPSIRRRLPSSRTKSHRSTVTGRHTRSREHPGWADARSDDPIQLRCALDVHPLTRRSSLRRADGSIPA